MLNVPYKIGLEVFVHCTCYSYRAQCEQAKAEMRDERKAKAMAGARQRPKQAATVVGPMPFLRSSLRHFQIKSLASIAYQDGPTYIMRRSGRLAVKEVAEAREVHNAPRAQTSMKIKGKAATASSVPSCLPAHTGLLSSQLRMKQTLIHHLRLHENVKPKYSRWTIQISLNETRIVHGKLEHMYRAQGVLRMLF